jgi:hypothetical protein
MNRARDGRGAEREVLDEVAFESGRIFRPSNPGRRLVTFQNTHLRSMGRNLPTVLLWLLGDRQ